MNRIRLGSLGLAACAMFAAAICTSGSDACSCIPPPEPKKALAQSAAVFLAKVVEIEDAGDMTKIVTLDVEKWWKGGEAARIKVATASNGAACGFSFQGGERYLVYAHGAGKKGDLLQVSLCSRSRSAKTAEGTGDFKDLGDGKTPTPKK